MKTVTELVEKGDDFVVGKERWLARDRCREVANQIGNGILYGITLAPSRDSLIHPGAASLRFTCVWIQIELPEHVTGQVFHLEETD